MNQVSLQPIASAEAEAAAVWYETRQSGLGVEFVLELDAALERACSAPLQYRSLYPGLHRILLRRFPYAVYFCFSSGLVDVIAVLHQHQSPEH